MGRVALAADDFEPSPTAREQVAATLSAALSI
jgi:hypothetical protein